MVQMLTAYTEEVDEVEDALNEIFGQIDLAALKKNSVGLITCHFDFTDTGFIAELRRRLPFDVIGMTTIASANKYGHSMYALSLTVLTSDDVAFETSMSGPLGNSDYREKIEAAYSGAVKKRPEKPSMIITFFPYINNISGAQMHRAFDDVCAGIPFWGSLATDPEVGYEHPCVFLNGDTSRDGMVMALLYGPVDPEFIVVSIPTQNIRKDRGQITSSDGCVLKDINGVPALKYMGNFGVMLNDNASVITPLLVYYEGSSVPVALAVYSVNDDGDLLCGGEMTEGASIAVADINSDGIMTSAGEGLSRVLDCGKQSGALMLPCVTRYIMLLPDHNSEMDFVIDRMKNKKDLPFMVGYSGGEICPVRDESGELRNRFHNYSFSACVF